MPNTRASYLFRPGHGQTTLGDDGRTMSDPRSLSRRDVLRAAAAGTGIALLGSCDSGSTPRASGSPRATTPSLTPTSGGPSAPATPRWADLRGQLTGMLLLRGDGGYDAARLSANPRYDSLHPGAIARCAGAKDVAAVIAFARDQRLPFSVRSGGHSYPGWSTGAGLVLDVSTMSSVRADRGARTVRVGAGARLVDVYSGVAGAGLAVAAGSCPSVGVAGLTLGGGVGVLSRSWGLTCDAITSYQVVTAEGRVREVDARNDPDLFWAGKGGGGGSFGVVTAITLAARPAPALTVFAVHWPWNAAADVVEAWQRWGPTTDPRCWSTCKLHAGAGSAPTVLVAGVWNGPDSELAATLAPLLSSVGAAPTSRSSRRYSYLDAMLSEAGCVGAGCHLPPAGSLQREPLAATSHVPSTVMSSAAARALVGAVEGAAGTLGLRQVSASLDALGGAVEQVAPDATAFVHRRAPFTVQYTATWSETSLPGSRFDSVVRGMRARMTPYLGDGAYVNYCDASLTGWEQAYWGTNYPRLQAVKRATDPDGVFSFPQAVRT
jgi:FAD/FMN-containing dehydrogenase